MTTITPDKKEDLPEPTLDPGVAPEDSDTLTDDMDSHLPDIPTTLNEELDEKIRDNPNKFIGCGG